MLLYAYRFRVAFPVDKDAFGRQTTHRCLHEEFVCIKNKSADKEAIGKNDKYVAKNEIEAKINKE